MSRENMLTLRQSETVDPRQRFPSPPFPENKQTPPGSSEQLRPPADYGETTYLGTGKLLGRAALITGADSGIGRAVALCFAKEGADVLFGYLPEEEKDAQESIRLVEAVGRRAIGIAGDIREKAFCIRLVDETLRTFNHLDILVNNAAFQRTHEKLEEIPEDEFDATFRTNVYATFFLTQAALPKMQAGGVILNTCSIEAYQPAESLVAYAATKSAMIADSVSSRISDEGGTDRGGLPIRDLPLSPWVMRMVFANPDSIAAAA